MRPAWCLACGIAISVGWVSPTTAGVASRAAEETAEVVLRTFGKEAAEEGAETLAGRLERLALDHGEEALTAARRTGPAGIRRDREPLRAGPVGVHLTQEARQVVRWRLVVDQADLQKGVTIVQRAAAAETESCQLHVAAGLLHAIGHLEPGVRVLGTPRRLHEIRQVGCPLADRAQAMSPACSTATHSRLLASGVRNRCTPCCHPPPMVATACDLQNSADERSRPLEPGRRYLQTRRNHDLGGLTFAYRVG